METEIMGFANQEGIDLALQRLQKRVDALGVDETRVYDSDNLRRVVRDLIALIQNELSHPVIVVKAG